MTNNLQNVSDICLTLNEPLSVDESISECNYHQYEPVVGTNLNNNSQIRIIIENQDLFYLPHKSFLTIKGTIKKSDNSDLASTDLCTFVNNGVLYLFDRIEYQMSDKIIESVNYPGHASLIKGLLSYSNNFDGLNMCYVKDSDNGSSSLTNNKGFKVRHNKIIERGKGNFSFVIPLSHIFGFCEDYKKVIYGVKHSLILTRCGDEDACHINPPATGDTALSVKVNISNITWTMLNIKPSFEQEHILNKIIASKNSINIGFLYRNMDQLDVPISNEFTWRLGPRTASEKPRWIIICFQTNKSKNNSNSAIFDHCDVRSIHVELNALRYPNIDIINNFANEDYSLSYYFAKQFKQIIYGTSDDFSISQNDYKTIYPLFVYDVTRQSER